MTGPHSVEELLFHMHTVERLATDERTRGFAASIRRQSRCRDWQPTAKQLGTMRRIVSEIFRHREEADDRVVIDD